MCSFPESPFSANNFVFCYIRVWIALFSGDVRRFWFIAIKFMYVIYDSDILMIVLMYLPTYMQYYWHCPGFQFLLVAVGEEVSSHFWWCFRVSLGDHDFIESPSCPTHGWATCLTLHSWARLACLILFYNLCTLCDFAVVVSRDI